MVSLMQWVMALVTSFVFGTPDAGAANFPERPVRFVVGFPAGGGTDLLARIVGQRLSEKWGQPVVVDNRPGADGTIGAGMVARAAADGYTVLMATINHAVTPNVYKLDFDPIKSFAPVTLLVFAPEVIFVHPSVPVSSVKELIALAKAKPGQLNFGSNGMAGTPFLEMALFMRQTGTIMTDVPYKGGAPMLTALLSGDIHLMFSSVTIGLELVKSGKLKALAVSTKVRIPVMPNVPTVAEAANLPGFEGGNWYGVLAPAGTPKDVISKWHGDIVASVRSSDIQQRLNSQAYLTIANTPEEFREFIRNEVSKWSALMKTLAVK